MDLQARKKIFGRQRLKVIFIKFSGSLSFAAAPPSVNRTVVGPSTLMPNLIWNTDFYKPAFLIEPRE